MTTMTLDDVRPATGTRREAAAEPLLRCKLLAGWSAEIRPSGTSSARARPTAALQRRLIAGLVG